MDLNKGLSERVQTMKPSGMRKFFDLAKQVEGVISLGVGEPDFDTPWHIREAAVYSIQSGQTTYTENSGLLSLRKEICKYQKKRYGLEYKPEQAIITVGGSEGIDIALRALINVGDEVIIPTPSYVAYEPGVILAGGVVKLLPLTSENEFKVTPEALTACINEKTKAIILNFPNNPTGGTMSHEDYEKLVPIIKESGIIVLSDEIYSDLIYEGKHASLAQFDEIKDQVVIISGCSKAFSMTGWRLGYLLGNTTLIKAMLKIHQYVIMSAPTMSQYAAIEGFKHGDADVEQMRLAYLGRRNLIVKRFNDMGLPTHTPKGAFYIFPDIRSTGLTSEEFCNALLEDQKVACVPGSAFGDAGEGFIRVSYAYSIEELTAAADRIKLFMDKLNKNK